MVSGGWGRILHRTAETSPTCQAGCCYWSGRREVDGGCFKIPFLARQQICFASVPPPAKHFSRCCEMWPLWRQQDPTPRGCNKPHVPPKPRLRWPLVPTATVPTHFQTFNLLTPRRPWEAGKVVLSLFYSTKHKWFPYKYRASWQ